MMTATFYIKQNDTAPSLEVALKGSNGRARNLENASSVRFHMSKENNGGNAITNGVCVITDAIKGIVSYPWQAGDTANTGTYDAEFEVLYSNGQNETFPNSAFIKVIIREELA
jgi:hypothetical protein